jgi:hypothetical protein
MKKLVILILITVTVLPLFAFAQSSYTQPNYNPSVTLDNSSGGTFGNGFRFQGVGAAALNCSKLTRKAAVAIGDFIDKKKGVVAKL